MKKFKYITNQREVYFKDLTNGMVYDVLKFVPRTGKMDYSELTIIINGFEVGFRVTDLEMEMFIDITSELRNGIIDDILL